MLSGQPEGLMQLGLGEQGIRCYGGLALCRGPGLLVLQ